MSQSVAAADLTGLQGVDTYKRGEQKGEHAFSPLIGNRHGATAAHKTSGEHQTLT